MSRIFDALQRSVAEQSGVEYPDLMSVVAAGLELPEEQAIVKTPTARVASLDTVESAPTATVAESADINPLDFPSLEPEVRPSSRLVFLTDPGGLAAEKFRFLGIRLRHLRQSRNLKSVLVTSTIPEEGKSLVSANLAGVLAGKKQKVLLIEGDLRRPVLMQQFGLRMLPGLAEWLKAGNQKMAHIYYLRGPNLWLMPAGQAPDNALELMQSGRLAQLMSEVTPIFDWIVVDSPPLLPLGDTSMWMRLTDGTLLIAREGKTAREPLQQGLELLKKSDLVGVVLNGCMDLNQRNHYQYYSPAAKK